MLYYINFCHIILHQIALAMSTTKLQYLTSYHIMLYHIISCCIILYHVVSYYIILYHVISCCIILYVMLYHIISHYVISYYIKLYYIISYQICNQRCMCAAWQDTNIRFRCWTRRASHCDRTQIGTMLQVSKYGKTKRKKKEKIKNIGRRFNKYHYL